MAFTKSTANLNIIAALADEPNDEGGLTPAGFKAKFDEAGLSLQTAHNGLIDELEASTAAGNLGFAATAEIDEDTVQAAIVNVQAQLAAVSAGAVADGTITAAKLATDAVETAKIKDGNVTLAKLESALQKLTFFGKYSQASGGAATVWGSAAKIAFSTEDKDDFSAINLATNNTRITIPSGVTLVRFWVRSDTEMTFGASQYLKLYKNNALLLRICGGSSGASPYTLSTAGTFTTSPLSVSENDYFEVYADQYINSSGLIFGMEVLG